MKILLNLCLIGLTALAAMASADEAYPIADGATQVFAFHRLGIATCSLTVVRKGSNYILTTDENVRAKFEGTWPDTAKSAVPFSLTSDSRSVNATLNVDFGNVGGVIQPTGFQYELINTPAYDIGYSSFCNNLSPVR